MSEIADTTKTALHIITPYEWLLIKVTLAACALMGAGVYVLAASV
jgi:hypothetical protein